MSKVSIELSTLTNIANATRQRREETEEYAVTDIAQKISDIPYYYDYENHRVELLSYCVFYLDKKVRSINCTHEKLKEVESHACNGASSLKSVYLPTITTLGNCAFQDCVSLISVNLPNVKTIGTKAFCGCSSLTEIDLPCVESISDGAFTDATQLNTLIIRYTGKIVPSTSPSLSGTAIANGNGYIYVPRVWLQDGEANKDKDYRRATNWSAYASQFRALEDYTIDGTITGELDMNKVDGIN